MLVPVEFIHRTPPNTRDKFSATLRRYFSDAEMGSKAGELYSLSILNLARYFYPSVKGITPGGGASELREKFWPVWWPTPPRSIDSMTGRPGALAGGCVCLSARSRSLLQGLLPRIVSLGGDRLPGRPFLPAPGRSLHLGEPGGVPGRFHFQDVRLSYRRCTSPRTGDTIFACT